MLPTILIAYALYCLAAVLLQDLLIYPRWITGEPATPPPFAQAVTLEPEPGVSVEAWWFPPPEGESPAPAAMLFHGNGELIDSLVPEALDYRRLGFAVLLVEYRGYGRSDGAPSQAALRTDAVLAFDWLASRDDVDAARIVVSGTSLGGAVAADLTRKRTPAALVLSSTFTSMERMFAERLIPPFLCRSPFRTVDRLREYDGPILLLHGLDDRNIRARHGRRLARAAGDNATYHEVPGGHYLGVEWSGYHDAVRSFLHEHALLPDA